MTDVLDRAMPGGEDENGAAQVARQDAARDAERAEAERNWKARRAWAHLACGGRP